MFRYNLYDCMSVIIFYELLLMYKCLNAALRAAYLRIETPNKSYVGFEVRFGGCVLEFQIAGQTYTPVTPNQKQVDTALTPQTAPS